MPTREFEYLVLGSLWEKDPEGVLASAREAAAEQGISLAGEPVPYTVLVWPEALPEHAPPDVVTFVGDVGG